MLILLLVVLLLASLFGGPYIARNPGYARWSPAAIVLVVLLVLFLTGELGSLPRGGLDLGGHLGHCRC